MLAKGKQDRFFLVDVHGSKPGTVSAGLSRLVAAQLVDVVNVRCGTWHYRIREEALARCQRIAAGEEKMPAPDHTPPPAGHGIRERPEEYRGDGRARRQSWKQIRGIM